MTIDKIKAAIKTLTQAQPSDVSLTSGYLLAFDGTIMGKNYPGYADLIVHGNCNIKFVVDVIRSILQRHPETIAPVAAMLYQMLGPTTTLTQQEVTPDERDTQQDTQLSGSDGEDQLPGGINPGGVPSTSRDSDDEIPQGYFS